MAAAPIPQAPAVPRANAVAFGPGNEQIVIAQALLPLPQNFHFTMVHAPHSPSATLTLIDPRGLQTSMYLSFMPGCCGMMVAHDLSGPATDLMMDCAERIARACGYSCLTYTTVPRQGNIITMLKKREFAAKQTFRSVRTGAEITIWTKLVA